MPLRWSNVTWADNYWRKDTGLPGLCHDCDFDGMALSAGQVFNVSLLGPLGEANGDSDDCLFGCRLEHSKTHTWYHGTIAGATADPDCAVNPSGAWYTNAEPGCASWVCTGYAHSAIAGGARPALATGAELVPNDVLYNGSFERSYSGWQYHGGGGAATVVNEPGTANEYVRLEPTKSTRVHNRFYLPAGAINVRMDALVLSASADDQVHVRLIGTSGTVHDLAPVAVATASSAWSVGHIVPIDASVPRDASYRLELALVSHVGGLTAVVGIDNVAIEVVDARRLVGDLNGDGAVDGADLGHLLASWGACAGCPADLDGNGAVDGSDLGALLANWTTPR